MDNHAATAYLVDEGGKQVDQLLSGAGADFQNSAVADVSEDASVVPETEDVS